MSKNTKNTTDKNAELRREFLKKAGKVAAAIPVATLLLAAKSKNAAAGNPIVVGYGGIPTP